MADQLRNGPVERDIEQAITALKKGAYLLKYGRRGKPKFCPFRLSNDETTLIWYSGKDEKQLKLSSVSRIVPGQRTAIFQRYPRPEKEYQSFSLICNDRSLDLICKDKDEAEVWFTGLRALLSIVPNRKWKLDSKSDGAPSSDVNSPIVYTRKNSPLSSPFGSTESLSQEGVDTNGSPSPYGSPPRYGLGKALSDGELHPMHLKNAFESHSVGGSVHFIGSDGGSENVNAQARVSSLESVRVSMSSAFSSSSQGSGQDDADALGDVYMWGEGVGDGYLGGGVHKIGQAIGSKMDALLPKTFESTAVLDVKYIACGGRHAALVTKQGEAFCWGEESGGRLGHGVDADVSHPQLIESLSTTHVELVACGEYHTCAVSASGELYTWGDGTHNFGLLGHGNDVSHWMPKRINGILDGLRISSVSCGPWHTSLVTSAGQLFTFGDGAFGVLGHGNTCSVSSPREVDLLKGLRTVRVACGVWHTAAVVEVMMGAASNCSSAKLFTWGDGDKGRLGHGDKEQKLVPTCVAALVEYSFKQVACGHSLTVALTTSGQVFTMGSPVYGQLGNPQADGKTPGRVEGKLRDTSVEEIACGAFHVAVLTSRLDIYTWGKGANGRLGHGDVSDRNMPTLVEALKDKHAKAVSCGSSFTAAICLHKWVSGADQSMCSGCRLPFGFTRKRHNCYNCGLVFCHNCSSKKALKASLAPCQIKPYRVCDPCSLKLKKAAENGYMSKALSLKKVGISRASPPEIKERTDVKIPRPQPQFAKIASLDQFKLEETKSFSRRNSRRPDSTSSSRVSPVRNGSSQWGIPSAPPSVHLAFGPPRRMQSASVPHSRIVSRATSPISSRRASPPRATAAPVPIFMGLNFPKTIDEDTKKTNEALSQEVVKLRSQVDNLSRCRQLQEVELKRLTHQLQEAINIAEDESSKCKAAKEVIKSLTSQLKDMAERLPGGLYRNPRQGMVPSVHANGLNGSLSQQVRGSEIPDTIQPLFRSLAESPVEPTTKASVVLSSLSDRALRCTGGNQVANDGNRSDGHQSIIGNGDDATTPTGNGNGAPNEPEEWVVQDEPGVYITLTSLAGDGKDLKRVRFSRKRFSEKQAELWWQENKARVHEQYNVRVVERSSITGLPRADEERGPFATSSSSID